MNTATVLLVRLTTGEFWVGSALAPNNPAHAVTTVAQGFKLIGPATAGKIQRNLSGWGESLAAAGFSAIVSWS